MTRRCSYCGHNGHNSRTCPNRGVKLFGVRITDGFIRKSASMGNLSHLAGSGGGASPADGAEPGAAAEGYASDDFVQGSSSSCRERKKGVPWTEEEHRMFLLGLKKLGKGDWRGISRNYVVSRTPTQVASHAQKYFIRQTNITRRKRRSSLFDMVPDEPVELMPFPVSFKEPEAEGINQTTAAPPSLFEESESMESITSNIMEAPTPNPETLQGSFPVILQPYLPPFMQFPLHFWPTGYQANVTEQAVERERHEIVRPTAVHSKSPINVDELVGMSQLSIAESNGAMVPSSLSLNLLRDSNRRSAFHPNSSTKGQA